MIQPMNDLEPRSEFVRLIAAVQNGDPDATRRLYDDYGPYILRAVRRRLHARMRTKFDSVDFAQDVWASFFADGIDKYELNSPEDLVRLLMKMARNKVLGTLRSRTQGQKHNIRTEKSLDAQLDGGAQVAAHQQTPSQIVMDKEAWNELLASQPPVYRCILLMLRDGKSHETIAQELNVSLRTVQRVISKMNT